MAPFRHGTGGFPARDGARREVERAGNTGCAAKCVDELLDCFHGTSVTITVMFAQAAITNFVIDGSLRFPQCCGMLTHEEIREELIRQIDADIVKQIAVARKLNIAPARVAEMRKRIRRVQQDELVPLAELLGMIEQTGLTNATPVESEEQIPYLGRVAQGQWLEQSLVASDPEDQRYVAYDRMKGDPGTKDLFAVTPEGTSMNLAFPDPRTQLICRRIVFGTGNLESGDYVIAERTAHDLRELTCKRVEIDDDGVFWLHSESDDPRFQDPWRIGCPDDQHHIDMEITVVAKVIRAVRDFERRD